MSKNAKYIVYAIIALALLGLLGQLFTNPGNFFKSILIMIGSAVVIGLIFYYLIFARGRGEQAKYRQAVKQSKKKYASANSTFQPGIIRKPNKIRNHAPHLRVIKGNKK